MLRRKHKMRKKRGGAGFFNKFKDGFNTVKTTFEQGAVKAQEGISNAKMLGEQARQAHANEINRAAVGGDIDPVLSFDYEKFENEEFGKYTSPLARRHNRGSEFSRNSYHKPIRKPILTSIPKNPEKLEAIKTVTFGGGRKRKTRRRKKRGGNDPTIGEKVFVKWPHDDGSYKYYIGKFMGRYKKDNKWYKWAEYDESTQAYKKTQGINFEIYPFVSILPAEVEAAQGLTELIDSNNQNVEDPHWVVAEKEKQEDEESAKLIKKKEKNAEKLVEDVKYLI